MGKLVVQRLMQLIPVLIMVSIIVFTAMRLAPGDPAILMLGKEAGRPENKPKLEQLRKEMGIDKPIPVQYLIWAQDIARGDFGVSNRSGEPVWKLIVQKLPATFELVFASLVFSLIVSLPLGIISSVKHRSPIDYLAAMFASAGLAIPGFWLGLALILVFGVGLDWFPTSGYVPFFEDPIGNLRHLVLPMVTLGVYLAATFTRFLRADMLEVLNQDYMRTAKAKGLAQSMVIMRHALPNALVPLLTIMGMEIGSLLGGAIVIEQVFGWSGIGWLSVQAIFNRDYPLVQGTVLFVCVAFVIVNLLVDIGYAIVNPRVRSQY